MAKTKPAFLAMAVVALALAGCRQPTPVLTIESLPYQAEAGASAQQPTLSEYERAIIRAGSNRGWTFSRLETGHLEGRILVRGKHTAVVDVFFDDETFSILYKDSSNLEYNEAAATIHPNYNSWVRNLEQDIQAEVQRLRFS
ncbi:MAG: hypothetical protein AAF416_04525 [Pseudomonadota bacterium]